MARVVRPVQTHQRRIALGHISVALGLKARPSIANALRHVAGDGVFPARRSIGHELRAMQRCPAVPPVPPRSRRRRPETQQDVRAAQLMKSRARRAFETRRCWRIDLENPNAGDPQHRFAVKFLEFLKLAAVGKPRGISRYRWYPPVARRYVDFSRHRPARRGLGVQRNAGGSRPGDDVAFDRRRMAVVFSDMIVDAANAAVHLGATQRLDVMTSPVAANTSCRLPKHAP